jgi:predicted TIM-barrel fold metal-dependent hydrolase
MSRINRRDLMTAAVAAAGARGIAAAQTAVQPQASPAPGPMDRILLKDYRPESSLVVTRTSVPRAKFPAIDAHAHTYARTPEQVAQWVRTMDEAGVEVTVILAGATGANFDRLVDMYLKPYPARFQLYCGIDTSNAEAADYPQRAASELERCFRNGARGVGEVSDKGSGLTRGALLPRDRRLHVDDARLDPFWSKCSELKIPVNLHIADHPSCWRPPDERQERTPNFQHFNQYGRDVPSYEELLVKRDRLLTRHPKTTFIFCHLSNQGNDLASLSKVLDRFSNLYLDISARNYEVGRQPRSAAKFLTRYKDRILFGTDQGMDKSMYEAWWRLFETADEYIDGPVWWQLYGLELPDSVLKPLYRDNARRLLNWDRAS